MSEFFLEECRALRDGAAFVDRSARGRIAAAGRDRLTYLHAMLTNDVASLRPGTGCYAAYLTPQGRMIADMRVLELGDLTLVDVEPQVRAVVLERLEQFIFSEDVQLTDLTRQLAEFGLYGAQAARVLSAVLSSPDGLSEAALEALPEHQSVRAELGGASVVIAGDRDLGVVGFDVYLDAGRTQEFLAAAKQAGAREAGEKAADALRIEAGRPRFGVDMNDSTIPLEAGIEPRAISLTKGCYPGQEVITRVLHRGHGRVAKKLVGMKVSGHEVPAHGDRVLHDDKEVGLVTSATLSPSLSSPIALGYVQRDFVEPGTDVSIAHGDARLPATVTELPFVPVGKPSRP